nr:MAG TPA_asm: hypothetical protein [Caudoviricetes sp.]
MFDFLVCPLYYKSVPRDRAKMAEVLAIIG